MTLNTPAPDKGGVDAPPSDSSEAAARFIVANVASPNLVDPAAVLVGGVQLAASVRVGAGSYLHGGDAPTVSVGAGTIIGQNTSVHELTFTSVTIGANAIIGDRVVLHGPLLLGDRVRVGNGTVLFGPRVAPGVNIGENVLAFGPIDITSDVPANSILVAPGNEALIAPSHSGPSGTRPLSTAMEEHWHNGRRFAGGCGCGLAAGLHCFG